MGRANPERSRHAGVMGLNGRITDERIVVRAAFVLQWCLLPTSSTLE